MFEYRTELFGTGLKLWFRDSANEQELAQLDEFITQKQAEGWERSPSVWLRSASVSLYRSCPSGENHQPFTMRSAVVSHTKK